MRVIQEGRKFTFIKTEEEKKEIKVKEQLPFNVAELQEMVLSLMDNNMIVSEENEKLKNIDLAEIQSVVMGLMDVVMEMQNQGGI